MIIKNTFFITDYTKVMNEYDQKFPENILTALSFESNSSEKFASCDIFGNICYFENLDN